MTRGPPCPPDSVEGVDVPPADDGCQIVPGDAEI
jgi:hypothetical protein